jgi:hypothetical protein
MSSSVVTAPRRVLAVLIAAALAFVVLPIATAQAAVAGTVTRTTAASVFPTANAPFTFSVTNSGAAVVGESVNWVRFILPSDEAGVVHNAELLVPPAGWTASREGTSDPADTQTVTYRTSSATAAIRPGASQSFTLPAEVLRPASSDRSGQFTVAASSDSGRTTKGLVGASPAALTTDVRILQVVGTPAATAPPGVTNQSGTGGQAITYGYSVKNYALNAVSVAGALTSNGGDTIGASAPVTASGNPAKDYGSEPTVAVSHAVTLAAATADRTSTFSAKATSSGAESAAKTAPFTVQVPALLQLSDLQPKRVRTTAGSSEVVFSALASKTGSPMLTVSGGQLDLAGVKIALDGTPLSFGSGANSRRVDFKPTQLSTTALGSLVGERLVNATATVVSKDANDFDAIKGANVLTDSITVDNLAPDLTLQVALPVDADGRQQTAARNGNRISVSGTIVGMDAAPTATPGPRQLKVVISDGTNEFPVPVTITQGSGGAFTYSGSISPAYAPGATAATAKASVSDTAGNIGTSPLAGYIIDNVLPELTDPGFTTTTRSILVSFKDENVNLFGGCDPRHYRVDGVPGLVERVEFPDSSTATGGTGVACAKNEAAPGFSGKRVLVLRNAMDDTATPTVTYEAVARSLSGDPVKDGAANDALRRTIDTIRQIAPLAPELVSVTRNKGTETATRVDSANGPSTYFTRFSKSEGTTNDDLNVSFLGSKNGYRIEVVEVDAAGKVLRVLKGADVVGAATPLSDGRQSITVPLNATDGTYLRALRFTASNGKLLGDLAPFNVVLDTVRPALATRSASGNNVTVTFQEVIQSGGEFASDWFGLARTSTGASRSYQAETVTVQSPTSRLLSVPFPSGTTFDGVQYRFTSGPDGGRPYLDRAGNALADSRI